MIQLKILFAEDHPILRRPIRIMLLKNFGIKEIAEVSTCDDLMKRLAKSEFTHLVLDIMLADGNSLEILPEIRTHYPDLQIMMFSMFPCQTFEQRLREYGVHLYLEKSDSEEVLVQTFRQFLQDVQQYAKFPAFNPFLSLAPRELKVLVYIMQGMSRKEIDEIMGLKPNTISTFKRRIYEKTKTSNFVELREFVQQYKRYFPY